MWDGNRNKNGKKGKQQKPEMKLCRWDSFFVFWYTVRYGSCILYGVYCILECTARTHTANKWHIKTAEEFSQFSFSISPGPFIYSTTLYRFGPSSLLIAVELSIFSSYFLFRNNSNAETHTRQRSAQPAIYSKLYLSEDFSYFRIIANVLFIFSFSFLFFSLVRPRQRPCARFPAHKVMIVFLVASAERTHPVFCVCCKYFIYEFSFCWFAVRLQCLSSLISFFPHIFWQTTPCLYVSKKKNNKQTLRG